MHATNDDKLVLMAQSFVPSTDSVSHHNISAQDQVTAFLHVRLKQIPDASSLFETWLSSIMAASQKWNPGAWAGRMVLPTPIRNEYVILFRFKTHALMQGWLTSAERRKWMVQLDSMGCSEQVGWDLQEGIVAFMPQSMVDVAWRCVSTRDDMQDDYLHKQTRSEPPPKWKSALVVWLSLQLTVLPWDLGVAPLLNTMGLPLGWRILLTLLCVVPTLKLVLLPLLDRCCHCFLFGQRCPRVEPCLSLQIGCACCRHHSPKNDNKADDRVASLELYVQSTRRMQSAARRRLLERIERLELLERGRHNELGEVGEEKKMTRIISSFLKTSLMGATLVAATALAATPAVAQNADKIFNYKGADRQQMLEKGAKKEGKVTFYSALIVNQALRPLAESFEKKYPYIDVEYWRGNSSKIIKKVLAEKRAKNVVGDIASGSGLAASLIKGGAAASFQSPETAPYSKQFVNQAVVCPV